MRPEAYSGCQRIPAKAERSGRGDFERGAFPAVRSWYLSPDVPSSRVGKTLLSCHKKTGELCLQLWPKCDGMGQVLRHRGPCLLGVLRAQRVNNRGVI